MRDISQMCQAYALMGCNCSLLFAVVANHLLEYGPGSSSNSGSGSSTVTAPSSSTTNNRGSGAAAHQLGYTGSRQQLLQRPQQQQQQQQWNVQASVLTAASSSIDHGSSSSSSSSSQHHAKGRGPRRLAECRPGDAAGLAWAYVAAFCPHQLLLQELAAVLAACAGQLHAADCCRLLWAYSTAGVTDARMLAAVTAATAEEMHGVLPRTAAGAVWSLAQMRFEAPAFMEAALDRLALCLEATPVETSGSSSSMGSGHCSSGSTHGTPSSSTQQHAAAARAAATAPMGSATAMDSSSSSSSSAVDRPSVLQQLLQAPPAVLLSCGPEARSTPAGELSMLGMMHRRRRSSGSSQQQQQQQQLNGQTPQPQQQQQQQKQGMGYDSCDDAIMLQEEQQQWQHLSELDEQQQQQQQQQQQRARVPYMAGELVQCSHRDVAQAVYACGRLQHYNGAFFRVLRGKLPGLLPGFTDVQLVEVLWGLAQLNLYHGPNMEAAASELLQRAPRLPASLTALSAWSFASLKHSSAALSGALARRAVQLAGRRQLRPLDASQLVRAAARLGHRHEALFRACAEVLQQHMPRLGDSMLVSSLWAFAVAGVLPSSLFCQGCLKLSSLPPDRARPLLLLQLFQAVTLLQDAFSGTGLALLPRCPPS
ncbi:hypothetical protein COO60DRAFT_468044 [Scenedesmus sp. NREL 46B-D3]|nr:hypothetical protein COO60DRAFT_468044 [Scenedesmus sp. NREL 46B-D3]